MCVSAEASLCDAAVCVSAEASVCGNALMCGNAESVDEVGMTVTGKAGD